MRPIRPPVSLTGKNLHLSFGSNHVLRGIDLHVERAPPPR